MEKLRINQEDEEEEEEEKLSSSSSLSPLNLHNLSKLILPPLGVNYSDRDLRENRGGGRIISPMDSMYRCWETWIVCLVIYSAFVYPFQLAFLNSYTGSITTRCVTILNTIVDAFFANDIILTFFVAYFDSTTQMLVKNPNKIATRYLSSWFIMDVASTIPFNAIGSISIDKVGNRFPYNLLWILRFWRLNKIHQYFKRLEKDIRFNYFLVRCIRLLFVTLFLVHCVGCGFYLMAVLHPHNGRTWMRTVELLNLSEVDIWIRYTTAIYWSTTTIANVGYGDIHAVNSLEMCFSTFCMLLNLGFTSYLIGNITNLVVEGIRKRTMDFRNNIQVASTFVSRNNLPKRLKEQMLTHMCLKFRAEYLNQQHLMDELPTSINKTICHHLFLPILNNVYLFKGVSVEALLLLAANMRTEYIPPKEDVIKYKQGPDEIYIVVSGQIEIIELQDYRNERVRETIVGVLRTDSIFGEISVLCNIPQTHTFRTRSLSQLLKLKHTDFFQSMKIMQEDGDVIKKNFFQQHAVSVNFKGRKSSRTVDYHDQNENGIEESNSSNDDESGGVDLVINVRVSVFRCHPLLKREADSEVIGKLITLPHTMEDLKNIIKKKLMVDANNIVIMNDRGAEVDSIELIRDNDSLFCSY